MERSIDIAFDRAFNDFTNRIFHRVKSNLSTSTLSVKLSVYNDEQIIKYLFISYA